MAPSVSADPVLTLAVTFKLMDMLVALMVCVVDLKLCVFSAFAKRGSRSKNGEHLYFVESLIVQWAVSDSRGFGGE